MKNLLSVLLLSGALLTLTTKSGFAQTAPASNALSGVNDDSNYYKFASLVRSANLDATLKAIGSYTVFAPSNVIFRNMSQSKLDSVTSDPVKLAKVLKAHIVKGRYTKTDIIRLLGMGKGKTKLTNLLGETLKLSRDSKNQLLITDAEGNKAYFLSFDLIDPHGVIDGIDNVLSVGK